MVVDPQGVLIRTLGSVGTEPGQFRYPYGVELLEDGSVLVTEFGNSRLQILTAEGISKEILGKTGNGDGELLAPWAAVADSGTIFVLDSRNNRVQILEH